MILIVLLHSFHLDGIVLGGATYIIILLGRYSCIAGEYYFTKKIWKLFLGLGLLSLVLSLFVSNLMLSGILSITGFTYLWGIKEVIEQEKRVHKGWFPKNPKRR